MCSDLVSSTTDNISPSVGFVDSQCRSPRRNLEGWLGSGVSSAEAVSLGSTGLDEICEVLITSWGSKRSTSASRFPESVSATSTCERNVLRASAMASMYGWYSPSYAKRTRTMTSAFLAAHQGQ